MFEDFFFKCSNLHLWYSQLCHEQEVNLSDQGRLFYGHVNRKTRFYLTKNPTIWTKNQHI